MNIAQILTPERVGFDIEATSKKRALELLSALLAEHQQNLTTCQVFDSLLARERLSSTGLGRGVGLPHGRLKDLDRSLCAFVRLHEGIDFDSNDGQPVDLLCALLVPEQSTDEHLQLLATLAEMFRDQELCRRLRAASSREDLYRILVHWHPSDRSTPEPDPGHRAAS
ncbi:MAG TPA: PTS IIA-like nitrogen-regulatory protein PtsN [Gammaproteobacteria bacterium]|nr:PTS IIA-like nitrogen-regulatory protein PtsN [Gammaproteobacteria bacterium]